MFVYAALGVSVTAYAPYAVLCWITALVVLVFGYLNIAMHRLKPSEEEEEEDQQ